MGFEIPGWLKPVMNIVAGPFPEGDETAMRRLAEEWETIGYAIAECKACTDPAMTAALSAIEGEIHKGMDDFWKHVSKDGGLIEGLSAYCDDKAKQLYEGANEIELTKYVIVGSLVALAAQLMIGVAIPLLGQAENAAAIIATRVGIRMAIRELIKKLLEKGMMSAARKVALRTLREAAIGAVFMGGVNLAAQDIQGLKGDRDSLNWGSLGQSLGMGAAAGAVGGPLGLGIGTVLGRTVSTGLGRFAVTTVAATAGGLAGAPAAMAAPALWGQEVHLDPHVILNGGIVGAVTGGATHGVHTVIASRAAANAPHVPTVLPQLPDSVVPLAESAAAAGPKPALAAQAEAPPVVHPEPAAAQGDPAIQAASAITPETVLPGDAAPAPAAGGPDAPASATTTPHPAPAAPNTETPVNAVRPEVPAPAAVRPEQLGNLRPEPLAQPRLNEAQTPLRPGAARPEPAQVVPKETAQPEPGATAREIAAAKAREAEANAARVPVEEGNPPNGRTQARPDSESPTPHPEAERAKPTENQPPARESPPPPESAAPTRPRLSNDDAEPGRAPAPAHNGPRLEQPAPVPHAEPPAEAPMLVRGVPGPDGAPAPGRPGHPGEAMVARGDNMPPRPPWHEPEIPPQAPRRSIIGSFLDLFRARTEPQVNVRTDDSTHPYGPDEQAPQARPDNSGPAHPEPGARPQVGDLVAQHGKVTKQFAKILDGVYGGLRVRVEDANAYGNWAMLTADILDVNGRSVGTLIRRYALEGGALYVSHSRMELVESVRGGKFATEFNRAMEQWYHESGVEWIELRANIDVGSYAWARQGYTFANPREAVRTFLPRLDQQIELAARQRDQLQQEINRLPSGPARSQQEARHNQLSQTIDDAVALRKRFRPNDGPDFPTPREISELGRPSGMTPEQSRNSTWLGKSVLLGDNIGWDGVKNLAALREADPTLARPEPDTTHGVREADPTPPAAHDPGDGAAPHPQPAQRDIFHRFLDLFQREPAPHPDTNGWPANNIHNVDTRRSNLEEWVRYINGPGAHTYERANNCPLTADAVLRTWFGRPHEALPLAPHELDGLPWQVAEALTGGRLENTSYGDIWQRLTKMGDGSAAMIGTEWLGPHGPLGWGHTFIAVNRGGEILFVDGQHSQVHGWPPRYPPHEVGRSQAVFLTPTGEPVWPVAPRPPASTMHPDAHQPTVPRPPRPPEQSRLDVTQPNLRLAPPEQHARPTDLTTPMRGHPPDRPRSGEPLHGESPHPRRTDAPDDTGPAHPQDTHPAEPNAPAPHPSVGEEPAPAEQPTRGHSPEPPEPLPDTTPEAGGGPVNIHNVDTSRANLEEWVKYINGPGPHEPGRSTNCALTTDAVLSTWFGRPREADIVGPEHPEGLPVEVAEQFTGGARHESDFFEIWKSLQKLGDGAAAYVTVDWIGPDGNRAGGHSFAAVNRGGEILLVDGQHSRVHGWPPRYKPEQTGYIDAVLLKPSGEPVDPVGTHHPYKPGQAEPPQQPKPPTPGHSTSGHPADRTRSGPPAHDLPEPAPVAKSHDTTQPDLPVLRPHDGDDSAPDPAAAHHREPDGGDDPPGGERTSLSELITKPGDLTAEFRQVIDGEYGGLEVRVRHADGRPGGRLADMTADIFDGAEHVGSMIRFYNRESDGRLIVNHLDLEIAKNVRGNGFATEFNNAMETWYRASGVDQIRLHATTDLGSYAWARQGYRFADPAKAVSTVGPKLEAQIRSTDRELQGLTEQINRLPAGAERAQLQSRHDQLGRTLDEALALQARFHPDAPDFPTPREISELGRPAGIPSDRLRDMTWLGKAVLMGKPCSWNGVKDMTGQ